MDYIKQEHYKNLDFYVTKLFVLYSKYHEKLLYYDSSTIIYRNIDYYFENYNQSTYYKMFNHVDNLTANFFFVCCNPYYIKKGLYIIKNYCKIFEKTNLIYTMDENVIFYSIYPNWNKSTINNNFYNTNLQETRYFDIDIENIPKFKLFKSVNFSIVIKPFIFPLMLQNNEEPTMFSSNFLHYKIFDLGVKKLINKFKDFKIYFDYIKTFRYTYKK
jgi:hypothetical protein